jgi:predicted CXXCH cytochrome family protein
MCHLVAVRHPSRLDVQAAVPGFQCFTLQSAQRPAMNLSLLCLSCHDGVMVPAPPTSERWFSGTQIPGVQADGTTQLQEIGHHPFGVEYTPHWGTGLLAYSEVRKCGLPLSRLAGSPAGSLECPTCHDPHSPAGESYLRVTMDEYKLCLCCHQQLPELSRQVYLPMQKELEVIESGDCRSCHQK